MSGARGERKGDHEVERRMSHQEKLRGGFEVTRDTKLSVKGCPLH